MEVRTVFPPAQNEVLPLIAADGNVLMWDQTTGEETFNPNYVSGHNFQIYFALKEQSFFIKFCQTTDIPPAFCNEKIILSKYIFICF